MSDDVYVASSWRNRRQPEIVRAIRETGLSVYDFRNPAPGNNGFHWSEIDKDWKQWTPKQYIRALGHPIAEAGFVRDMSALRGCSACVLVLPCGRSAHLELGYAVGAGKQTAILLDSGEPELMNRMVGLITDSVPELLTWLVFGRQP